ncbi:MAG: hypothetical protein ACI311_01595 [Bacilli bacterium]
MDCSCNDENIDQEVETFNLDIIMSLLFIVAILIAVYITVRRKFNVINNNNTSDELTRLGKIGEFSLMIVIIAALYFVYTTLRTYRKDPTTTNFGYFFAAFLVLVAAIIRLFTLFRSSTVIEGAEDIIG